MKRDEKMNRLSHWWREVEAHSHDDEQLRRKLHLMEAEIRHVLRERAAGATQWKRNLAAMTILVAIIALTLGMLRFIGLPDASRHSFEEAITVASQRDVVFVKASSELPLGGVVSSSASQALKSAVNTRVARSYVRPRKTAPVSSPARVVAPAVSKEKSTAAPAVDSSPSTAPASVTPGDPGLDALALLSALESEFEK